MGLTEGLHGIWGLQGTCRGCGRCSVKFMVHTGVHEPGRVAASRGARRVNERQHCARAEHARSFFKCDKSPRFVTHFTPCAVPSDRIRNSPGGFRHRSLLTLDKYGCPICSKAPEKGEDSSFIDDGFVAFMLQASKGLQIAAR